MGERALQSPKKALLQFCMMEFTFGMAGATLVVVVLFFQTKGLSVAQVGMVTSINSLVGVVATPLWGMISDKIRSRYRALVLTFFIGGILLAFLPVAARIRIGGTLLAVFLFPVSNFFRQPTYSIVDTMIVEACKQVPGMEYSFVRMCSSIGYTMMSFLYTPLMKVFSVDFPFYMFCVFCLLVVALSRLVKSFDIKNAEHGGMETAGKKQKLHISYIFKNYYLMIFVIVNMFFAIATGSVQYLVYLVKEVQGDVNAISFMAGIRTVFEIMVLFYIGKWKKRFTLPALLCVGGAVYGLELLLYPFCQSIVMITTVEILDGIGYGFILGCAVNYTYALSPKGLEATSISLYTIGASLVGILTSAIGGVYIERFGIRSFYLTMGIIVLFAVLFFLFSFWFGRKILKKEPPIPLCNKKSSRTSYS